MTQNRIWLAIAALAEDLLTWTARLALPATAAAYDRTPPTPHPQDQPSLAMG